MLDINELIRRFDRCIPGEALPNLGISPPLVDIFFETLSMDGLDEMHRYSTNPEFYEFLEFEPFRDINETKTYIEKLLARMAGKGPDKTGNYWFVRRKSDNYLVGTAALVELSHTRQSVCWGYGVDPELWGEGYILQIQELLKHFVFEVLELNRLSGTTMITNKRTIASLQAAGMKNEGSFRDYFCKDGKYIDSWEYAMLRADYLSQATDISHEVADRHVNNVSTSTDAIQASDIIEVIAAVITEEEITLDSGMDNVMTWDSLNHMNIMVALNEKKGIKLSPAEITRATSIKAIMSLLEAKSAR